MTTATAAEDLVTTTVAAGAAPRLLTMDDAIRMTEIRVIAEGERLELIDGLLVAMSPDGRTHRWLVGDVNRPLSDHYRPPYRVYVQCPLRLDPINYRIPDFVVSDAPLLQREPRPEEVALIVEVAWSSLTYDLEKKAVAYAAWGAPAYWVLDIRGQLSIVHSEPGPEGYRRVTTLVPGDSAALPRLQVAVDVADLQPPPA